MATSCFTHIRPVVLKHLRQAQGSVEAAVAWFTDQGIFDLLLDLLQRGVAVRVIITSDSINQATGFDWDKFGKLGGQAYMYGDKQQTMHHKFCLIDGQTLLTGSYNWTYRAAHANRETLLVFEPGDNFADIPVFQQEFHAMLAESVLLTPVAVTQREAVPSVSATLIRDLEPDRLKARIRMLEMELSVLQETKTRLEGLVDRYVHRLRLELGDLLNRIAELKTKLAERIAQQSGRRSDAERADEARRLFDQTRQQVSDAQATLQQIVQPDLANDLRKLYYRAAMKAHPDRFLNDPDRYARATAFMAELNRAYRRNDAEAVRQLVADLDDELIFREDRIAETDRDILKKLLKRLEQRKAALEQDVATLQTHEACSWNVTDADGYFARLRAQLIQQIQTLEAQLINS
ncbi:phospholipase D-like domain-containing protein [Spirosoma sp.]|uniref:phospholipase D-like domain-containing protein n=1 Tax=Spirosoma sp. TaxID=1899569 RepID=UPI003B3AFAC2